jgi:hypothetical protein
MFFLSSYAARAMAEADIERQKKVWWGRRLLGVPILALYITLLVFIGQGVASGALSTMWAKGMIVLVPIALLMIVDLLGLARKKVRLFCLAAIGALLFASTIVVGILLPKTPALWGVFFALLAVMVLRVFLSFQEVRIRIPEDAEKKAEKAANKARKAAVKEFDEAAAQKKAEAKTEAAANQPVAEAAAPVAAEETTTADAAATWV